GFRLDNFAAHPVNEKFATDQVRGDFFCTSSKERFRQAGILFSHDQISVFCNAVGNIICLPWFILRPKQKLEGVSCIRIKIFLNPESNSQIMECKLTISLHDMPFY